MKHYGSILEFTDERNEDLMRAWRQAACSAAAINAGDIARQVARTPSRRFWVSETRAKIVVTQIDRGLPVLETMRPEKRAMYEEIYQRVCMRRKARPQEHLSDTVTAVVNEPAPRFYLEPRTVWEYLARIRSGWYDRRNQENNR